MADQLELLPCPFCGGAACVADADDDGCYSVGCPECDYDLMGGPIGIGWWPSAWAASFAWNMRPVPVDAVSASGPRIACCECGTAIGLVAPPMCYECARRVALHYLEADLAARRLSQGSEQPRSAAEVHEAMPDTPLARACRRFEQCAAAELPLSECMEAALAAAKDLAS